VAARGARAAKRPDALSQGANALLVADDPFFNTRRDEIVATCARPTDGVSNAAAAVNPRNRPIMTRPLNYPGQYARIIQETEFRTEIFA